MKKRLFLLWTVAVLMVALFLFLAYRLWLAPTRILVVNALPSQQADLVLNNDSRHIKVTCIDTEDLHRLMRWCSTAAIST